MAKRAADAAMEAAMKKERVALFSSMKPEGKNVDPEGSWECPFCHNINWPKRTSCNREGCHMPKELNGQEHPEGSWACLACSNINWSKRTECKKCKTPKSGLGALGLGLKLPGMAGAQPGSWVCPNCANVNWPARTVCNKPACQTPRPQNIGGLDLLGRGLDPFTLQSVLGGLGAQGGFGLQGGHPPGSWPCPSCGNINWPKRTQCNKPGCGAARPGYNSENPGHPEGSWVCPTCSNVNWPQRTAQQARLPDSATLKRQFLT